jgi:hypothetical protein
MTHIGVDHLQRASTTRMNYSTEKGTRVSHTERSAEIPSRRAGVFAMLRTCLHADGSSAPTHRSAAPAAHGKPALARRAFTLAALAAALGLALLAASSASAAFTRPFLCQIKPGTNGTPGTFSPGGVAVDVAGNLWVGDERESLDEFNSSCVFLGPKPGPKSLNLKEENPTPPGTPLTEPSSLAIDSLPSTGSFYEDFYFTARNDLSSANPPYVEVYEKTGKWSGTRKSVESFAHVAIDNSTDLSDLSAGSVYVASGNARTISKFNASLTPINFEGCGTCSSYVKGSQITGTPRGSFRGVLPTPEGVAVDSHGDIYAIAVIEHEGREEPEAVYEYKPSGEFVQAFTGGGTPGLGGSHEEGGFGGRLEGVAVDSSVSGHVHVLVSVYSHGNIEGAVDEFDAPSGRFLSQIAATSPGQALHSANELTADSHGDLYVVDESSKAVDVYGPGHFLPSLKIAEATEREPASALLSGSVNPEASVNPEESGLSACHFEYVSEAAFNATGFSNLSSGGEAPCVPSAGSIPADSNYHPVQAKITENVSSGTTYRYRLLATTSGALGGTTASGSLAFTAPHAPRVDSTTATNLSSTFADLRAQIDPLGADTTYQFQYVDAAQYEPAAEDPYAAGAVIPVVAADVGSGGPSGDADAAVLQQIGGLVPGTVYHFRVVATNDIGATPGPDATITTLPQVVPGLPDGRAYELVTPANKGGAEDMFGAVELEQRHFLNRDFGYPSESGEQFLLETNAAFGLFPATEHNAYVFSRTDAGWRTTALASPSLGVQSLDAPVFDPADFSRVGVDDGLGSSGGAAAQQLVNLIGPPGGPYTTLHTGAAGGSEGARTVGASHDLSHVVLESQNHTLDPVAKGQDPGSNALYESFEGELKLLNVKSNGSLLNPCGAILGQSTIPGAKHDAVSADGSKVLFTAPDPYAKNDGEGCWNGAGENTPQLYLRSGGSTVELSKAEKGVVDPSGRHSAIYVGASEDGSRVFFLTEAELTKDDLGIHDPELYEYDTGTKMLTRVSRGNSGKAAAAVFTVPAVSADGSAVYFTAVGQLTESAPANIGETEVDLYRYDTATGATAYVATIGKRDYPKTNTAGWWGGIGNGAIQGEVALDPEADWYTTPDGRYLLFGTASELTGYSTAEAKVTSRDCPALGGAANNGHCQEVYRYDSGGGGSLACVSCNPSGAAPTSNAFFGHSAGLGTPAAGPVRAISDNGSYAFFDTADALVPQDANGTLDVYEWHEGKVALISSGQDSFASYFLGASPDGKDVFFGTHARLVPQDIDTAGDLYDARICTGSDPCLKPPAGETAQCEGDACQNSPALPLAQAPATFTFASSGNVAAEVKLRVKPAKCKKGFAKKHNRCVRAKTKKKSKKAGNDRRAGR